MFKKLEHSLIVKNNFIKNKFNIITNIKFIISHYKLFPHFMVNFKKIIKLTIRNNSYIV